MNSQDLRISIEDLQDRLDAGEAIQFIDCRKEADWQASDEKIPGAIRVPPDDAAAYAKTLPEALLVAYCS